MRSDYGLSIDVDQEGNKLEKTCITPMKVLRGESEYILKDVIPVQASQLSEIILNTQNDNADIIEAIEEYHKGSDQLISWLNARGVNILDTFHKLILQTLEFEKDIQEEIRSDNKRYGTQSFK